jgi:hypothetical protein
MSARGIDLFIVAGFGGLATAAVFGVGTAVPWSYWTLALSGALSAGVIGAPAMFWMLEHGWARPWQLAFAGALAGLVPLAAALIAGMIGLAARGGLEHLRWVLGHGASLPAYGLIRWSAFLHLELLAMLAGAATGVLFGVVHRAAREAGRPGSAHSPIH